MYRPIPREQIADNLIHLRELFREIKPSSEKEVRAREKREVVTKNLLSNLFRMKEHPTLQTVLEIAEVFLLTLDGAHRMFGYRLEEIREYDSQLNGHLTHIERSHERLRPGEVHGSLGVSSTRERKRKQNWCHRARCAEQLSFGEGLRQSLGKAGCVAGDNDTVSTGHRLLRRLVSVGNMPELSVDDF